MGFDLEKRIATELNRVTDEDATHDHARPGKRTRAEHFTRLAAQLKERLLGNELATTDQVQPGKQTNIDDAVEQAIAAMAATVRRAQQSLANVTSPARNRFDEYRAVGLRDVLDAIGPVVTQRALRHTTIAAADPAVRRTARTASTNATPDAAGQAMWRAAERRAATLYRRAMDSGEVASEDPAVEEALSRCGTGQALPGGLRRKMEDELGVSLERVRVHSDPVAAEAAQAVRAEAFTVGEDIFFAANTYAPDTRDGQKLIAHELTHVVQGWQGRTAKSGGGIQVSRPGESLEQEADAVAERVDRRPRNDARSSGPGVVRGTPPAGAPVQRAPRAMASVSAPSRTASTGSSQFLLRKASSGASTGPKQGPKDKNDTEGAQRGTQPKLQISRDHAVEKTERAAKSAKDRMGDASAELTQRVQSATKGSVGQLKESIQQTKANPVGKKAGLVGKQLKAKTSQAKQQAKAAQKKAKGKVGKDIKGPQANADAKGGGEGNSKSPIKFKKVDDWSTYMPEPLPDQDERERKKILKLVKKQVNDDRRDSQKALEKLRQAQVKQAAAVRAMRPALQGQIASAQQRALGSVSAAESAQCAAVSAHVAGVQGQVRAHAGAMKGQIAAAHAAAMAQINAATQAANQKLQTAQQQAIQDITAAETAQIAVVAQQFSAAKSRITALGAAKGAEASALGSSISLPYDGEKLEAAQKAAKDVAAEYASAMPSEGAKAAAQLGAEQPKTEADVRKIATDQRKAIQDAFKETKKVIDQAHEQAVEGANQVKTQASAQVDQIASATSAQLAAHGAAQVSAIRGQAQAARSGITQSGQAAQAGLAKAVTQAAAGIEGGAKGLVHGAKKIEAPNPQETRQAVTEGTRELQQGTQQVAGGLKKSAAASGASLNSQASKAAAGMASTATAAKAAATQMGNGAKQTMTTTAQGASQGLQQLAQNYTKTTDQIVQAGEDAFKQQVTATKNAYQAATTQLSQGLNQAVQGVENSFNQAVPTKETADILANAKKAADAVKPWWQKALAFVVSIVVAVVVVVVVTALIVTTGPVGAILVGAAAGALGSVLGQMASNLVLGNGLMDGITWQTVALGAIGGGVGAGLTAGAGRLATSLAGGAGRVGTAATAVRTALNTPGGGSLAGFAIKTGVGTAGDVAGDAAAQLIVTGKYEFSMQNLITSVATNAITSTKGFENFQAATGGRLRNAVGLPPVNVDTGNVSVGGADGGGGGRANPGGGNAGGGGPSSAASAGGAPSARGGDGARTGGGGDNSPAARGGDNARGGNDSPGQSARGNDGDGARGRGNDNDGGGGNQRGRGNDNDGGGGNQRGRGNDNDGGGGNQRGRGNDNDGGGNQRNRGNDNDGGGNQRNRGNDNDNDGGGNQRNRGNDNDNDGGGNQRNRGNDNDNDGGGNQRGRDGDNDGGNQRGRDGDNDGGNQRGRDGDNDGGNQRGRDGDNDGNQRGRGDNDAKGKGDKDGDNDGNQRGRGDSDNAKGKGDKDGDADGAGDRDGGRDGDGGKDKGARNDDGGRGGDNDGGGDRTADADEATARDAELDELGYAQGTRAKADEAASTIEGGGKPGRDALRDTEANQQGRKDLQQIQEDPKLTPEQRTEINQDLGQTLRGKSEPTGNLPRDIQDVQTRQQARDQARQQQNGDADNATPTQDGPAQDGPAQDGPAQDGARTDANANAGAKRPGEKGGDGDGGGPSPQGPGPKPVRVIRQDNNFGNTTNRKGQAKPHLDGNGDLVPANPSGNATVTEHVIGRSPQKDDSPYTSFMSVQDGVAKPFGAQEIELDVARLQGDIQAGRVQGVELLSPDQVQAQIRAEIDAIQPGVDVAAAIANGPGGVRDYVKENFPNLSRKQRAELGDRLVAMYNTGRDGEWLTRGTVPARYFTPPKPTSQPPGGSNPSGPNGGPNPTGGGPNAAGPNPAGPNPAGPNPAGPNPAGPNPAGPNGSNPSGSTAARPAPSSTNGAPPTNAAQLGAGQPLPDAQRGSFEKSLGTDLSGVRVHTDEAAAAQTNAVGAKAVATGQDIAFGPGQFDPGSPQGQHMLAEEVAHTAQQQGAAPNDAPATTTPGDAAETQAKSAADAMVAGQPASVTSQPKTIARRANDESPSVDNAAGARGGDGAAAPGAGGDKEEVADFSSERVGQEEIEGTEPVGPDQNLEGGKNEMGAQGRAQPKDGGAEEAGGGIKPEGDAGDVGGGEGAGVEGEEQGPASPELIAAVEGAQADTREAVDQAESESAAYKAEMAEERAKFDQEQNALMLEKLKTMSPADKRATLVEMGWDKKKVKKIKDAELDAIIEGKISAENRKAKIMGMGPEELAGLSPSAKVQHLVDLGIDKKDLDKVGQAKACAAFDDIMKKAHIPGEHKVKIKVKGGLLGKSWVVSIKCDAEGNADVEAKKEGGFLSKLWGWVKLALPIVAIVLAPLTGGASLLVLGVYQAAMAIKNGNWLGAIIAVAGGITGFGAIQAAKGAMAAASTLGKIVSIAEKVKKVAEGAQAAMMAAKAKNAGSLLGALAGAAGTFAGFAKNSAGKFALAMKKWEARLTKWATVVKGAQTVAKGIKSGDAIGALGGAFDTAIGVVGAESKLGKNLTKATQITGFVSAGRTALKSSPPDYGAVAEAALGIAGTLKESKRLDDAAKIVGAANILKSAIQSKDPAAIAQAAMGLAETIQLAKYDADNPEQKDKDGNVIENPEADKKREEITNRYAKAANIVKGADAIVKAVSAKPRPNYLGALEAATQLAADLTANKKVDAAADITSKINAYTQAINSKDENAIMSAAIALGESINGLADVIKQEREEAKKEAQAQLGEGETLPEDGGDIPRFNETIDVVGTAPPVDTIPPELDTNLDLPAVVPNPSTSASGRANTAGANYTVIPGDTLSGIGSRFKVSVSRLQALNSQLVGGRIYVGQRLNVPGADTALTPSVTTDEKFDIDPSTVAAQKASAVRNAQIVVNTINAQCRDWQAENSLGADFYVYVRELKELVDALDRMLDLETSTAEGISAMIRSVNERFQGVNRLYGSRRGQKNFFIDAGMVTAIVARDGAGAIISALGSKPGSAAYQAAIAAIDEWGKNGSVKRILTAALTGGLLELVPDGTSLLSRQITEACREAGIVINDFLREYTRDPNMSEQKKQELIRQALAKVPRLFGLGWAKGKLDFSNVSESQLKQAVDELLFEAVKKATDAAN